MIIYDKRILRRYPWEVLESTLTPSATLTPSSTPSISSSLNSVYVTSDPANALVYLDTIYRVKTPLTITNVSTGDHMVELNAPGYSSWKTTVHLPGGGSTRTVSAKMTLAPGGSITTVTTSLAPTTTATAYLTPTATATKSGAAPVVAIIALGIIGLVAGIKHRKN